MDFEGDVLLKNGKRLPNAVTRDAAANRVQLGDAVVNPAPGVGHHVVFRKIRHPTYRSLPPTYCSLLTAYCSPFSAPSSLLTIIPIGSIAFGDYRHGDRPLDPEGGVVIAVTDCMLGGEKFTHLIEYFGVVFERDEPVCKPLGDIEHVSVAGGQLHAIMLEIGG